MSHGPHQYQQSPHDEQRVVTGVSATRIDEASPLDVLHLAFILIAELSACLNMISADLARSTDLETANQRWIQRLRALLSMLESHTTLRTHGPGARSGLGQRDERDKSAAYNVRAVHARSASLTPLTELTDSAHPRFRSMTGTRLTAREREILRLTQKGAPPRKIAHRLQLSVHTVYTHLRNARRKQRRHQAP